MPEHKADVARYHTVSRHLFRRTARARERTLTALLTNEDWEGLEAFGVLDPEGVIGFRVSPARTNGWWRVQWR